MPRLARIVLPGMPHHITQRGNRRQQVFFSDADRQKFLQLVFKYCTLHDLLILAYCLMPNHDHFICIPPVKETFELVFKPVHSRYAQDINRRYGFSGHLWQGRFFSFPMDIDHLWAAIRYVERNPVRAGLVCRAEDYPWSSAAAHCGLRSDPLISTIPEHLRLHVSNWSEWLSQPEDAGFLNQIRRHAQIGKPWLKGSR